MADSALIKGLKKIKRGADTKKALRIIREFESKPVNDPVSVGFIVQMPQVWHVQQSIYQKMCSDSRFDTWLIIIPSYNIREKRFEDNISDYFVNECVNGNMIAAIKDGVWADLDLDSFDYVFVQRPFSEYYPAHLKSWEIVLHTRLCYITYATHEFEDNDEYPNDFFKDVYLGFHEDESVADFLNAKYTKGTHQRFFSIGYTSYERGLALDKECSYSKVLWAPRWSTDPVVGGSHFLDYYEQLGAFDWGDNSFTVRPHPLMWDNFIKKEIITEEEKDKVLKSWSERGIKTDGNSSILDTYNDTDILISDISSVIPMFFMTGKPVIYCPFECEYTPSFSKILPGLYQADSWNELEDILKRLLSGDDPLRTERERILNEHFMKYNHSTEAIVEQVFSDAKTHPKK